MEASEGKKRPGFEPPPWEQDAFEELARKREAEDATRRWAAQAQAAREAAQEPRETEPVTEPEAVPGPEPAAEAPEPKAEEHQAAELDEQRVADMLGRLSSEEPKLQESIRPAANIAAVLTGLAGTAMTAVGLLGVSGAGGSAIGISGALITSTLGAMFVGTAIWIWIRATRGKGS